MSKEFKNIDGLFQSTFSGDELEVPAFVKGNIDKQLGKGKSKAGWIWLGALLLLIGASIPTFYYLNSDATEISALDSSSSAIPTNDDLSTLQNQSSTAPNSDARESEENNSITSVTSAAQVEDAQNSGVSTNAKQDVGNAPIIASGNNKGASNNQTNSTGTNRSTNATEQFNDATGKTNTGNDLGNESRTQYANEITTSSVTSIPEKSFGFLNPSLGMNVSNTYRIYPLARIKPEGQYAAQLDLAYKKEVQKLPNLAISNYPVKEAPQADIKPATNYQPWMISATFGPSFQQTKYQFQNSSDQTENTASLNEKISWNGDINVKYRLANSLTFGTGIAVETFSENYNFFKQDYTVDSILTWTYVYDSLDTNQTMPPIDSSYTIAGYDTTAITLYDQNGSSTMTQVSLPFSIGAQFIFGKFIVEPFIQGRLNYVVKSQGAYLENGSLVQYNSSNHPYKKFTLQASIGAQLHYQFYRNLYLTGAVRYSPAYRQIEQASFSKSASQFAFSIGVSMRF